MNLKFLLYLGNRLPFSNKKKIAVFLLLGSEKDQKLFSRIRCGSTGSKKDYRCEKLKIFRVLKCLMPQREYKVKELGNTGIIIDLHALFPQIALLCCRKICFLLIKDWMQLVKVFNKPYKVNFCEVNCLQRVHNFQVVYASIPYLSATFWIKHRNQVNKQNPLQGPTKMQLKSFQQILSSIEYQVLHQQNLEAKIIRAQNIHIFLLRFETFARIIGKVCSVFPQAYIEQSHSFCCGFTISQARFRKITTFDRIYALMCFSNRSLQQIDKNRKKMSKSVGNLKDSSLTPEVEFKLQDSGADFYLLCGQRLFPLRKQIAQRSPYLARSIRKNHRVHVVGTGAGAGQKYISGSALEKVLKLLYGGECNFQRGSQVLSLLESALLLEYNVPIFLLAGDIDSNFNDYEFFMVLEFSYRSGDQQLEKRCIRELIFHQFQQINYNRLGFLKSSRETAQKVLHLHRKLKNQGLIKGLTFSNLKEIIKDYNISNSTEINESILSPGCSSTIIEDENEDSEYVDATIKAQCSSAQACNEKDSDRPISPQNSSLLLVVDVMQKSQAEKLTSSRTQDLPLGQNREKQKCENSSLFNNQDLEGRSVRLKLRGQPHEDQLERSTSPTSECLLSSDIQLLQCPEGYQKLRPVRQSRQNSRKDLEIRGDPKERSSISLKTRRSMHSASKIFLSLDLKQIKYAPQFQTRDQFWEWD